MNQNIHQLIAALDPTQWQTPPEMLHLSPNMVHIWVASLRHPASKISTLRQLLTDDERARADRFYFEKDREAYTAARGQLRLLLSRYLHVAPTAPRFTYSKYGKPALVTSYSDATLHFNVSHSGDMAVYGFSWDNELGVDVEYKYRTPTPDFTGICTHFFAPSEQKIFLQHKGEAIRDAFYRCWTRKEAYLKASGEGLSRALDSFHVTLTAHEPAKLTYVKDEPEEIERWTMRHIKIGREYTAALCAEGDNPEMVCWKMG